MIELAPDRRPDTARFSSCGAYRYELTRELGGDRPLVICGLNPSIATADKNDPTIRKEIGFARLWGCGRLVKVNAYAFIATDPKDMKRAWKTGVDIVGPENDYYIRNAIDLARACRGIFLAAWGRNIRPERQLELARIVGPDALCLGANQDGSPVHPLYIPYERQLVPWSCP